MIEINQNKFHGCVNAFVYWNRDNKYNPYPVDLNSNWELNVSLMNEWNPLTGITWNLFTYFIIRKKSKKKNILPHDYSIKKVWKKHSNRWSYEYEIQIECA